MHILQLQRQRGFTLIEMVMVIVILGAVGGMVAVFMRSPIDAYFSSARRAALTDTADTTVRRMARDIRKALPNSIRTPGNQCLEFIPTKTGGRYRAEAGDDTSLNFNAPDTTFNMLGRNNGPVPADQRIAIGDVIVVYNLGIPGSDAYQQDNTSAVTAAPTEAGAPIETTITITSKQFPLASGSNRFHVVPGAEQVVGYICTGDGRLRRYVRALPYAAPDACPAAADVAAAPILASNVTDCMFDYGGSDLQRNALVRMVLQLTDSGESVTLQHEVHVNNTP
ncbi:MAG: type II secretion system protein [Pseudomonadota bacterium]